MAAAVVSHLVKVEPENEAWSINLAYSIAPDRGYRGGGSHSALEEHLYRIEEKIDGYNGKPKSKAELARSTIRVIKNRPS
jgi:hypothetical protein